VSRRLDYMHAFAAAWHDGPAVQGGLAQLCPSRPWTNQLVSPTSRCSTSSMIPNCAFGYEGSGPPHAKLFHLVLGFRDAQRSLVAIGAARYDQAMSGVPADLPPGSAVVLTNPDEDASPEAFRAFIDELLAGPEPELESVDGAAALRALRVDAQA
jgi:hypothetical protein